MPRKVLQVAEQKTPLSEDKIGIQNAHRHPKNFTTLDEENHRQMLPS